MTSMHLRHESTGSTPARLPVRTCVGCKERVPAVDLLRVVVGHSVVGQAVVEDVGLVPDIDRRLPGRGAWLHFDLKCLDNAVRRRAFGRALRVTGSVDPAAVRTFLEGTDAVDDKSERTVASERNAVPD